MIELTPEQAAAQRNRATIFVEDALVTEVRTFPGDQFILRLHAPGTASRAVPGSFVHIRCDDDIPMRRPLSIMRANVVDGWIEVLFKIVGNGLRSLGHKHPRDRMSIVGPIGKGFEPSRTRPRALLVGGGVGIPPIIFLAERMREDNADWQSLVLMGSEIPFPFDVGRSIIATEWLGKEFEAAMPLMEDWGVPSRLASLAGFDGVFRGYVSELARRWLEAQTEDALAQTEIFTCGPTPMLEAIARLAREFGVPCQASLEEFMACAVGGCAGCTVLVQSDQGPKMKRVCVDGPVFDAATVFPA
ncbi:MAG: dihydroorotate dehydrogenase electron transfer subunit [Woeseia sp.]